MQVYKPYAMLCYAMLCYAMLCYVQKTHVKPPNTLANITFTFTGEMQVYKPYAMLCSRYKVSTAICSIKHIKPTQKHVHMLHSLRLLAKSEANLQPI